MQTSTLLLAAIVLIAMAYWLGVKRSVAIASNIGGIRHLHSLPGYHGFITALWCGVPALFFLLLWVFNENGVITQLILADLPQEFHERTADHISLAINEIRNIANGTDIDPSHPAMLQAAEHYSNLTVIAAAAKSVLVLLIALVGAAFAWIRIRADLKAREQYEFAVKSFFIISSLIAIFTTVGIVLSVLFESIKFFQQVSIVEFLFGLEWSPQIALRADQQGSSGAFGAVPLFAGTFMIALIAMIIAVPVGLMSAIYLSEYASSKVRTYVKPVLEILAGIPTVVYGFFAALTAGPFIRDVAHSIGFSSASAESALAAGIVMGIMIIPFVSSISDDVITAVPSSLRDGSLGLGATKSETILKVIIPAALPGIVGGILLAASRAIGETMIVVMAAGLAANLTANPLESMTTVTVQIVTLLVGDQEFDSPKTLAAFALGLMLFLITLVLNFIALKIVNKYREVYD
jgi:phosphate transport system permease protein